VLKGSSSASLVSNPQGVISIGGSSKRSDSSAARGEVVFTEASPEGVFLLAFGKGLNIQHSQGKIISVRMLGGRPNPGSIQQTQ